MLKNSGIGDETYLPKSIFHPGDHRKTLKDGREEAAMVMFGAVKELLAATKIKIKDIRILIVNCGILNTTPSLSAMLVNHFKLKHDVQSFNLGGMGCAAGLIAIDLARDLLSVYPGSYALVVSMEAVSYSWYCGNNIDMLLPNCFFRMGAAAMLLSNRFLDRWRSKYELKQVSYTDSFFHAKMIYMMLYMNNHPSIFELKQAGIEEITHSSFSSIQIIRLHYMNNPSSIF